MKFSEIWLREWVNPALTREQLCAQLTMAGLEVDELAPAAAEFTNVVVAKVLSVEKHPEADRLNICQVDVNGAEPLTIVCGAKNVKAGMKVPAALVGASLPKTKITLSDIRGVTSHGMLCSAVELGLSEQGEGLLPLPHDAPVGESIWQYLKLADYVIDIAITPNRGDCLSIKGIAKEISALTQSQLMPIKISPIKRYFSLSESLKSSLESEEVKIPILIQASADCPRYVGRIVRNIRTDASTPIWMQERIRRAGIRCINPVVDVMNYVMLELGQPMHAFDLDKVSDHIEVRIAKENEELKLLDGQVVKLDNETLVIADNTGPLAIAGVMGGLDSGVGLMTENIFLESAYFHPNVIARAARRYGLGSDSSYRFERGIDPTSQVDAMERATELLLEIVGGEPGSIIEEKTIQHLPQDAKIMLRKARIAKILGFSIPDAEIENILQRLGFSLQKNLTDWEVTVPARRSDVTIEVDLIEEIIRLYGYDKLPEQESISSMQLHPRPENKLALPLLRRAFCDLGFNEIVSYSFIDKKLQTLFDPATAPIELVNPMTSDMGVMRTTLWVGLINTLMYNQNRQQPRVRLFETGLRFIPQPNQLLQQRMVSGLVSGSAFPEQWGIANRDVDFFDLKGDLQNVFKLTLASNEFTFKPANHPALHPGQTAEIYRGDQLIGIMGALHPSIRRELDLQGNVFLFEILLDSLETAHLSRYSEISKFPEIRRDLAILVDRAVPAQRIQDTIISVAGDLLQSVNVFDVYQGKNMAVDRKSIALALTLQHASRTLRDEEVADIVERILVELKDKFAAELRG